MPYLLFGWLRIEIDEEGGWSADTGSFLGDCFANWVARSVLQAICVIEQAFDVSIPVRMIPVTEIASADPR